MVILSVVAMLLAGGLAPSPAAADTASRCAGQPLKWTRDKALAQVAYERAQYGFRHDEAYLERRARRVRRHGRTTWVVPYSPAERRYLRARDRLWPLVRAADDYARRHAEADYGGAGIRDDWPRAAFVEARFTRDVDEHVAAIRARAGAGEAVRGRQVALSTGDLERLQARVEADRRSLAAEDLHVLLVDVDHDANVVSVGLWTPRPDAQQALSARYGDGVRADVLGTQATEEACNAVMGYRPSRSGRVLRVQWGGSGMLRLARVEVREYKRRVVIGVVVHRPVGFLTADLRLHVERVRLRRPLGRRSVIDAGTGTRLSPRDWLRLARPASPVP